MYTPIVLHFIVIRGRLEHESGITKEAEMNTLKPVPLTLQAFLTQCAPDT